VIIFFFQSEDGIRDRLVTGVQTCALPIYEQFYEFAKANKCAVNYVNILAGNEPCERAMKRFNFYKTGEPWEQSKGMLVQTYERMVDV